VLLGHVGQQAEGGQPDQEAVRRRPGAKRTFTKPWLGGCAGVPDDA